MPLLKAEADKLSNNDLVRGVIEEIIDRDSIFSVLPFVRVNGKAYVYNRENAISEGDFLDPNDTVNEGAATFTQVVTALKILAGDVDVDKFLQEVESDTTDQLATQIALKAKALARKANRTIITGSTLVDAKSFDGIARLAPAGNTFAAGANGAALTLTMLDELVDRVKTGRPDAILMRPGTVRAYKELLRTVGGGTDAVMLQLPNFSAPVLTHHGIPIIADDFLPGNETQGSSNVTCSVYAIRMNELDGLHGLYGGASAGIRVEEIGTVQNKDAWRVRVKWYLGLALKSTQSMARLTGVTNL
jgi:hypothetical protein